MVKKVTTEEIIERFKKIHGDKYDYSLVKYDKARHKVIIICKIHGEFMQVPHDHLRGSGCPKCYGRNIQKTLEQFLETAKSKHGNKYDYSKVTFTKVKDKVIIICSKHGEFLQTVDTHLRGSGCPKCCGRHKITDDIIKEFKIIFEDKYDYSLVKYMKSNEKVKILCSNHGIFELRCYKHLSGRGCQKIGQKHWKNSF